MKAFYKGFAFAVSEAVIQHSGCISHGVTKWGVIHVTHGTWACAAAAVVGDHSGKIV
jgi:hypothetical protein